MTDTADLAQAADDEFRDRALAGATRTRRPARPADICRSCGDPIPLERQKAIVTDLCVFCADQPRGW